MAERIAFDRTLYTPEAIEAAVAAYAEHATIEVAPSADAIVATISVDGDDSQTVVHAFCNHVLYETVTRRRQAALDERA